MSKNIKRILGIALVAIILLVFTACTGNDDTVAQPMELEPAQETNNNNYYTLQSDEEAEQVAAIHTDSWQEAYAETLRLYATGQNLREWETGWEFALHDINQDGIPELFLGARQISGHIDYRYVYTFFGGEETSAAVTRLDFEGFLTDGAIFSPIDNSPWVAAFIAVGSGGRYVKLEMIGLGLVPTVDGMASMSDEGHEMMFAYDDFDWQNYEWYYLTIDDIEVTAYEFESVFGTHRSRAWLGFHKANEVNIRSIIFSLEEPENEYFNNAPKITVRFYYHSIELDPNLYALPEAFLYNVEEIIAAEGFTATFSRLMYEHTGLQISDLWFEGDKLYVDLHEDAIGFFDHHGTTGGVINATIFEKSLLSMSGISSFEVLVNGQRGAYGSHFNFGHIAIVENGKVIRRELLPHPFATALREYMEGYDGVVCAYLVTLDDDGTIGVLTTRPTTRALVDYDTGEYAYGPSGLLFYMQDGNLFQIDVSGWFFVAGRHNRLMERLDAHTHIVEVIYKLEFGRLEISTQMLFYTNEYLTMLFENYAIVTEFIAERDALAAYAREKYGLVALPPPNYGHMRNTEDQTAQILAMTINCVPTIK